MNIPQDLLMLLVMFVVIIILGLVLARCLV